MHVAVFNRPRFYASNIVNTGVCIQASTQPLRRANFITSHDIVLFLSGSAGHMFTSSKTSGLVKVLRSDKLCFLPGLALTRLLKNTHSFADWQRTQGPKAELMRRFYCVWSAWIVFYSNKLGDSWQKDKLQTLIRDRPVNNLGVGFRRVCKN